MSTLRILTIAAFAGIFVGAIISVSYTVTR